ncbi:MAG: DUF1499 domain-containing protein [Gammaproteobacteria bacterium]
MPTTDAPSDRLARRIAALVIGAAIAGAALLAVAGPGYRFAGLPLMPALAGAALGNLLMAAAFVVGLVAFRMSIVHRTDDFPRLVVVLLACGPLALNFGYWVLRGREAPPIHDISTDTADPPAFNAVLPLREAAQAANPPQYVARAQVGETSIDVPAAQQQAYPDIKPLWLPIFPDEAYKRCERAVRIQGWKLVAATPETGVLEATDTSAYFGFTDDIVIRIRADGAGSRIDVRSKSRVGQGDLGANARRVRAVLDWLAKG